MKKSIYSNIVAVTLALCCFAGIAAAQAGVEGDTSISYDDETGMVTVYGETINGLDTDYASQMSVVVKDQNGTTVASGNDYQLWDNAAVALEFQATPGSVYTATSNHCVRMQSWSYDNEFPYHQFYYDYWYMSSFLGQNIYWPWYYWFASPGWQEVHRTTNVICTGKTYDTVTAAPITVSSTFSVVGKDQTRTVPVQVSNNSKAKAITFSIRRAQGSAGAAEIVGANTTNVKSGSVNLQIKGTELSDAKDNMILEAKVNNVLIQTSRSFSVGKIKISRTIGTGTPTDVTDTTSTTIVGERIKLKGETVPAGISLSSSVWTVPGNVAKSFDVVGSTGGKTPVDSLNTTDANYVWYDGGDSRGVTYSGSDGSYQLSGSTTFNVKRPLASVETVSTGNSATTIDSATGVLEMHYGLDTIQTAGIRFSRASLSTPSPFTGTTQWVQVVNVTTTTTTTGNVTSTDTASGLDKCYPYTTNVTNAWDSPGFRLDGFLNVNLSAQWTMWLMFKPSGDDSAWVPLRKVDWRWLAQAQQTNGVWALVSYTNPNNPAQPADADATTFPVWTAIVGTCGQ